MKNNKLKLSLVAAMMVGTYSVADTKINIGGDAEVKYASEEVNNNTNAFIETEVNLGLEAEMKSGTKFVYEGVVYDGVQAEQANAAASGMDTTLAYLSIPLESGFSVSAGLMPNNIYATDAFDNGGESWKTVLAKKLNPDTTVKLVLKKITEMEQNDGAGDKDQTVVQVTSKLGGASVGAKFGKTVQEADTANGVAAMDSTVANLYAMGEISGLSVGAEIATLGGDADGQGYIVSVGSSINDQLSASLAYAGLTDGMKGGDEFAPGSYFDGNVDSSAAKDTSAAVAGLEYAMPNGVTTSATFIAADVQGMDATEIVLGAEYGLNDDVTLALEYAQASGDALDALEGGDVTNMSVAVSTEF